MKEFRKIWSEEELQVGLEPPSGSYTVNIQVSLGRGGRDSPQHSNTTSCLWF